MKIAFLALPILFAAVWPTEREVQYKFDSIVASADEVEVDAMILLQNEPIGSWHRLLELKGHEELTSLSGFFRLQVPVAKDVIIDGKGGSSLECTRELCVGEFRLSVKKAGATILVFTVHHGAAISYRELLEPSDIALDEKRLAPFYARLKELKNKKWTSLIEPI